MSTAVCSVGALALAVAAAAFFALSQDRHWVGVMGRGPNRRRSPRKCRLVAWILVGSVCALLVVCEGASFGLILWPMMLLVGALATVACLSYRPPLLRFAGRMLATSKTKKS